LLIRWSKGKAKASVAQYLKKGIFGMGGSRENGIFGDVDKSDAKNAYN
jgi:hypothetical protein